MGPFSKVAEDIASENRQSELNVGCAPQLPVSLRSYLNLLQLSVLFLNPASLGREFKWGTHVCGAEWSV